MSSFLFLSAFQHLLPLGKRRIVVAVRGRHQPAERVRRSLDKRCADTGALLPFRLLRSLLPLHGVLRHFARAFLPGDSQAELVEQRAVAELASDFRGFERLPDIFEPKSVNPILLVLHRVDPNSLLPQCG